MSICGAPSRLFEPRAPQSIVMGSVGERRHLMARTTVILGLLLSSLDRVSDAFVLRASTPHRSTSSSRYHAATVEPARTLRRPGRGCGSIMNSSKQGLQPAGFMRRRCPGEARRRAVRPILMSFEPGAEAAAASTAGGGAGQEQGFDGDMAPIDLEQAMGSFSPEWANDTARVEAKEQLIKGSVIAADQTVFPYPVEDFPPLANSEVYYNGTFERYWWNQDSDAVNIYVPVPQGFDAGKVEFVAKTRHVSLKLDGEEILSGTPFYRIDGYESLYVLDSENDPPYVQLELFKVREFQNWEDLLLETSPFTPGGAQ